MTTKVFDFNKENVKDVNLYLDLVKKSFDPDFGNDCPITHIIVGFSTGENGLINFQAWTTGINENGEVIDALDSYIGNVNDLRISTLKKLGVAF